jgi:outer membrane protein OmpA-like peptidoglycan-associated protein
MKRIASLVVILGFAVSLFSCAGASHQQQGAAVGSGLGAGLGALLGQAIGGDTEGTLIGAGVGALVGAVAGDRMGAYMDRQEQELRSALAASEAASRQRTSDALASARVASVQRSQDVLTATFRSEVLFDFDSAVLKPGAYAELARVAAVLNRYPESTIMVEGHTDATGSEEHNQRLSQRRAQAVKDALIQRGVDPARIQALGYGESQPVSAADAMNRRVNIVIQPLPRARG